MCPDEVELLDPRFQDSRIAIIDDEIETLSAAIRALQHHGFANLVLLRRVDSLRRLLELNLDLVILDVLGVLSRDLAQGHKASADGAVVLGYLKDRDPSIDVILLSQGTYSLGDVETLSRADALLDKPLSSSGLIRTVEDVLVQHHNPEVQAQRALRVALRRIADADLPEHSRGSLIRRGEKLLASRRFSVDGARKFLEKSEKYVGASYYSSKIVAMLAEMLSRS